MLNNIENKVKNYLKPFFLDIDITQNVNNLIKLIISFLINFAK